MSSTPTPLSLTAIQDACAMPAKGARAYARVGLESGLGILFIRTSGRRNEPLEAWYVASSPVETLRINEAQVEKLLSLWDGSEISLQKQ